MLIRSALSELDWNWGQFGMKTKCQRTCSMMMKMMMYCITTLRPPASGSWCDTSGFCTMCESHATLHLMVQHVLHGRDCAHAEPHQGAERPNCTPAVLQACKNWWTVQIKRRELMSPGHFFCTNMNAVRCTCHAGWRFPFTNYEMSFFNRKNIFAIITCTKIGWCCAPVTPLPTFIYAPRQLAPALHLIPCYQQSAG